MFSYIRPQKFVFPCVLPTHSTCNHSKHASLNTEKPFFICSHPAAISRRRFGPHRNITIIAIPNSTRSCQPSSLVSSNFWTKRLQMSKMSDFLFISSRFEASPWHVELLTMRYMRVINAIKSETLDKHARTSGHHVAVPISRQREFCCSVKMRLGEGLKSAFWVGVQARCVLYSKIGSITLSVRVTIKHFISEPLPLSHSSSRSVLWHSAKTLSTPLRFCSAPYDELVFIQVNETTTTGLIPEMERVERVWKIQFKLNLIHSTMKFSSLSDKRNANPLRSFFPDCRRLSRRRQICSSARWNGKLSSSREKCFPPIHWTEFLIFSSSPPYAWVAFACLACVCLAADMADMKRKV